MSTADYYDSYWGEDGSGYAPVQSAQLADLLATYGRGGAADCLDVGCGDGRAAGSFLDAHARSYVGVDVSPAAVEVARGQGLDARVIDDAAELPFEDGVFDLVVCLEVFEHLFATEEAAAEIRRVLRPGGHAVIQVPNVAHWRHRLELTVRGRFVALGDLETLTRPWRDPHIRFFTAASLAGLFEHVGMSVVATRGFGRSQLTEVPGVHRLARRTDPGPISRGLFAARPSLFANRVQIVARR